MSKRAVRAARRHRVEVLRVRTTRHVGFTVLVEGRGDDQDRLLTAGGRVLLATGRPMLRRTLLKRDLHDLGEDAGLRRFLDDAPRLHTTRRCDLVWLQRVVQSDARVIMGLPRGPILDGLGMLWDFARARGDERALDELADAGPVGRLSLQLFESLDDPLGYADAVAALPWPAIRRAVRAQVETSTSSVRLLDS